MWRSFVARRRADRARASELLSLLRTRLLAQLPATVCCESLAAAPGEQQEASHAQAEARSSGDEQDEGDSDGEQTEHGGQLVDGAPHADAASPSAAGAALSLRPGASLPVARVFCAGLHAWVLLARAQRHARRTYSRRAVALLRAHAHKRAASRRSASQRQQAAVSFRAARLRGKSLRLWRDAARVLLRASVFAATKLRVLRLRSSVKVGKRARI